MSDWSYSEFYSKLSDLRGKLEDLYAIDYFYDHLPHGQLGQTIRCKADLGWYHPFTYETGGASVVRDPQALVDAAYGAARSWVEGIFSGADAGLSFLTGVSAGLFAPMVGGLGAEADRLASIGNTDDVGDLESYLADWDGSAYEDFMAFHGRLTTAAANQADLLKKAAGYLDLLGGYVAVQQVALLDGVTALEAAADQQLLKRAEDSRGDSVLVEFLTVASFATGAAGLIPGPQAILLGGASLAFSTATLLIPEDRKEQVSVKVTKAPEIAEQFTVLRDTAVDNGHRLLDDLHTQGTEPMHTLLHDEWPDGLVVPDTDIADRISPEEFHHRTSPYYVA